MMQLESKSFLEVCAELNIPLEGVDYTKVIPREYHPNDDVAPTESWQKAAYTFVAESYHTLWSDTGKNAREWLHGRGFSDDDIKRARLGYNPSTRWDDKKDWGIKDKEPHKKVWLPRGIIIPWLIDWQLWKVNIRRPNPDLERDKTRGVENSAKYVEVKGSSRGLYGVDWLDVKKPTLLVEGEFNKLIVQKVLRDQCNVIATGSTMHARGERWTLTLAQSPVVLVAYDADGGKGEKAAQDHWLRYIPHSVYWSPWEKDINDMYLAGQDISAWFNLGLEFATMMSRKMTLSQIVSVLSKVPADVSIDRPAEQCADSQADSQTDFTDDERIADQTMEELPNHCGDCGASMELNDRQFFPEIAEDGGIVFYCSLCRDESGEPLHPVADPTTDVAIQMPDEPMTREQFTALAEHLAVECGLHIREVYPVADREQVYARTGHQDKTAEQARDASWRKVREGRERFDPSKPVDWWRYGFYKDDQDKWRSETRETRSVQAKLEALYKRLPFDEYVHHFRRMMKRPEGDSSRSWVSGA